MKNVSNNLQAYLPVSHHSNLSHTPLPHASPTAIQVAAAVAERKKERENDAKRLKTRAGNREGERKGSRSRAVTEGDVLETRSAPKHMLTGTSPSPSSNLKVRGATPTGTPTGTAAEGGTTILRVGVLKERKERDPSRHKRRQGESMTPQPQRSSKESVRGEGGRAASRGGPSTPRNLKDRAASVDRVGDGGGRFRGI